MDIFEPPEDLFAAIAAAADLCMKPWRHAVVSQSPFLVNELADTRELDLMLKIECRSYEGKRHPENDIEIEIFRSGNDFSLTFSWCTKPDHPILWQGKHSIWMDCNSGSRCNQPLEAHLFESFARRLHALFSTSNFR